MSFPRYESYKDSGIEWLGEVPEHWKIRRLKHVANVYLSNVDKHTIDGQKAVILCNYIDVYKNDRITSEIEFMRATATDEQIERLSLQKEDVIITKDSEDPSDIGIPALVVEDISGLVCGYHLAIVRPADSVGGFLAYLFQSIFVRSMFEVQATGLTRYALGKYSIENFTFTLPHCKEQIDIAAFLDSETAKIDALIAEQQRLIELLKEKRQAVISHAVTKGLNPDAPMKDSGIEWLGEIPEHWDRVQLGRVCRQVSDGPHFSPNYVDEGIMFLSARNISVNSWLLEDAKFISESDYIEFSKRIVPEEGDILYTKGGTTGIARVVDLKDRFQVWVHVAVLKIERGLADPYFIAYALNSSGCYEQSQLYTRGATNQDLGLTRMIKIWLALPAHSEQFAIVAFIDRETAKIDALTAEAQIAITLLQERRTALISAAVTGKIDVRGLVETQPEREAAA